MSCRTPSLEVFVVCGRNIFAERNNGVHTLGCHLKGTILLLVIICDTNILQRDENNNNEIYWYVLKHDISTLLFEDREENNFKIQRTNL